jgi:predicted metal-binding protein
MKAKSKKIKDLIPYTMPATIALRWCFTNCNGDIQLLKQLMTMMREHFEGHHANCIHPFKSKCSDTKIESLVAKEEFKVSVNIFFNDIHRNCGIITTQLQKDTQKE